MEVREEYMEVQEETTIMRHPNYAFMFFYQLNFVLVIVYKIWAHFIVSLGCVIEKKLVFFFNVFHSFLALASLH